MQSSFNHVGSGKAFPLESLTSADIQALGRELDVLQMTSRSMESAAQRVSTLLCERLITHGGNGACALARVFLTLIYRELPDDLKTHARRTTPEISYSPSTPCLTLLGTHGDQQDWRSRHLSQGHRCIPLPSVEAIERAPMIANLLRQLGCELNWVVEPKADILLMRQKTFNVFFVPEAKGSAYIPAQETFVIPHGIHSVVGFGGVLPSGRLFITILFLKAAIREEIALNFSGLALTLRTLFAPLETQIFYRPAPA